MLRITPLSFQRANVCFEHAMTLDPGYAEPHANLGLNYLLSAMMGLRSPRDSMPLIRVEANEALRLNRSDPGPHFLLGAVAAAYEYDWKQALDHFGIALRGTPVSAEAHWAYASLYLQPLGRFDEAVFEMEQAVECDPLSAHWRGVLASHLTHAERHDEAIRQANEALEIDETNIAPHTTLGEAYTTLGRWAEAVAVLEKVHRIQPSEGMSTGMLAGALVRMGDRVRADELIREMGDVPRPLIGRVLYYWVCGETDHAAEWYERAINGRDPFALVFALSPLGRAFRKSPRWPVLAKMMNLPQAA
jgi:adenylate cyclase